MDCMTKQDAEAEDIVKPSYLKGRRFEGNLLHGNNPRETHQPPTHPTIRASKMPLPSHVNTKYATSPTTTSRLRAQTRFSRHVGSKGNGGPKRGSSFPPTASSGR